MTGPGEDPAVDDDPLAEAETIPAELTGEPGDAGGQAGAGGGPDAAGEPDPPAPPADVAGHRPAADPDVGAGAD